MTKYKLTIMILYIPNKQMDGDDDIDFVASFDWARISW